MLGRFGLKAGSPTVREQSAGAFAGDIGISSITLAELRYGVAKNRYSDKNAIALVMSDN